MIFFLTKFFVKLVSIDKNKTLGLNFVIFCKKIFKLLFISFSCIYLLITNSYAAGFYIRESSIMHLGSAFSGVTGTANDPSTVFFNPAGLTEFDHVEVSMGSNLIVLKGKIIDQGTNASGVLAGNFDLASDGGEPYDKAIVPNLYVVIPINDRLGFGFGLNAPFGLVNEYDNPWFGRYDSTRNELKTIYTTFAFGYEATDWLSLGASVNIIKTYAKLENSVANPIAFGGDSALDFQTELEGDAYSKGFSLSALVKPADGTKIGIQYRFRTVHNLKGEVRTFDQDGAQINILSLPNIGASVTFPDILQIGIEQEITDTWKVMANVDWFNWSLFDKLEAFNAGDAQDFKDGTIQPGEIFLSEEQGYKDTITISLGTEVQLSDCLAIRGGVSYDPTPTVDEHRSTRIPDADRIWVGLGASYEIMDGIIIDAAWARIFADTPLIDRVHEFEDGGGNDLNVNVRGKIDVSGDIFSIATRVKF